MDIRLFDFEWRADAGGYDFEPADQPSASQTLMGHSRAAQMLLGADPEGRIVRRGGAMRPYKPLEVAPRLHRDFVERVTDPDGALQFVRDFGFLGFFDGGADAAGEGVRSMLDRRHNLAAVLDRIDHPDRYPGSAADCFNENVTPHLTVKIGESRRYGLVVQIVPRTLISCMWLLVAQEIAEGVEWKTCKNPRCGAPFSVDRDRRRQRREYCEGDACKQAAKRERDRKKLLEREER